MDYPFHLLGHLDLEVFLFKFHLQFARHTVSESEQFVPVDGKINKRVWVVHDKANNHWLDAYALACAAAGCAGLRLVNPEPEPVKQTAKPEPKPKPVPPPPSQPDPAPDPEKPQPEKPGGGSAFPWGKLLIPAVIAILTAGTLFVPGWAKVIIDVVIKLLSGLAF
jgi:hypothetical protein